MPSDPDRTPSIAFSALLTDLVTDPAPVLERLRAAGPVTRLRTSSGETVWVVTAERDVRAGLADPRLVTAAQPVCPAPGTRALQLSLLNYGPDQHARLRRLAAGCFGSARVQTYRPTVEAIAHEVVTGLAAGGPVDLLADFARPFSGRVVSELFGLAGSDRALFYTGSLALVANPRRPRQERNEATYLIETVIESEVARRLDPGNNAGGILSAVVHAWQADQDRTGAPRVSREELLSLCGMLLLAGFDTTAQMICLAVVAILTHPQLRDRLRSDPEALPAVVEELLRWDTPGPFATRRIALTDLELGGVLIPAGATVLLSVLAANRDPRDRADPDVLDPDRGSGARHLTFSLGPHYCLGAPLARLELTVALSALLRHQPDLSLAVPVSHLPWGGSHLNRGLRALPVFTAAASG